MKTLILFITAFFISTASIAQERVVWNENDVPAHIVKEFMESYPGSLNVKWETDRNGNYIASFIRGKDNWEAMFSPAGDLLASQEGMSRDEFPERLGEAVGNYLGTDFKVERSSRVDHFSGVSYYMVDVKVDGRRETIVVDPDGTILPGPQFTYEE